MAQESKRLTKNECDCAALPGPEGHKSVVDTPEERAVVAVEPLEAVGGATSPARRHLRLLHRKRGADGGSDERQDRGVGELIETLQGLLGHGDALHDVRVGQDGHEVILFAMLLVMHVLVRARERVHGRRYGLDGDGVEPEHGAEAVRGLERLGAHRLAEVPAVRAVLLLGVEVRVARSDHVEMGEADASDGAVEREGRELPDIVATRRYLLVGRDDDSDGCRGD